MRVYRRYRCEFGHEWTVERRQGEAEAHGDARCPEGHEAITCNEELPVDEVQILLRPAARIVDGVTGTAWQIGRYFLVLLNRSDDELCVSREHYVWDEAIRLAALFKGKDPTQAMSLWQRKAL